MSEPHWLPLETALKIHDKMIEIASGATGVRDTALLESALARPINAWAYGEQDLFIMATSLAEGIAQNHPFVDGNKRTAFQSAVVFLRANGIKLTAHTDDTYVDTMVALAQSLLTRESFAQILRENTEES